MSPCDFLHFLEFLAAYVRSATSEAVVINSIAITVVYYIDVQSGYKHIIHQGKPRVVVRAVTYALIAISSTISGACLIKYTPGVLHK